jgi:hypothetical protein
LPTTNVSIASSRTSVATTLHRPSFKILSNVRRPPPLLAAANAAP